MNCFGKPKRFNEYSSRFYLIAPALRSINMLFITNTPLLLSPVVGAFTVEVLDGL